VFSCDYNGWADVPEEEREGIDVFESTHLSAATPVDVPFRIEAPLIPLRHLPERRAA
jgi:hypothetical protein